MPPITRSSTTRTRARTRSSTTRTTRPRRTPYNKKKRVEKPEKNIGQVQDTSSVVEDLPSAPSASTTSSDSCRTIGGGFPNIEDDDVSNSPSTPKAEKFRIPEIATCPPAPKKQRVISNCSLRRRPIAFFASPDIELFFLFSLRDISV